MAEFKHQEYALGVTVTREEMEKPHPRREPFWRKPLVKLGVVKPLPAMTALELMRQMEEAQAARMQLLYAEIEARLSSNGGAA